MRRLVVTGRCKDDELLFALLRHLGARALVPLAKLLLRNKRRQTLWLTLPLIKVTFMSQNGSWEFLMSVTGRWVTGYIHRRLTESTRTHTFHWRCYFPEW